MFPSIEILLSITVVVLYFIYAAYIILDVFVNDKYPQNINLLMGHKEGITIVKDSKDVVILLAIALFIGLTIGTLTFLLLFLWKLIVPILLIVGSVFVVRAFKRISKKLVWMKDLLHKHKNDKGVEKLEFPGYKEEIE